MRICFAIFLATALALSASCKGSSHDRHAYTESFRDVFGAALDSMKLVAVRDSKQIVRIDLQTMELEELGGAYAPRERYDGLSRPYWSPDGDLLVFSWDRKCFLMNADGSDIRQVLQSEPNVYDPKFWRDPQSGELCIVFVDRKSKNKLTRGKYGNTMLARLRGLTTEVLFDIPCDAGLSADGRYLGESYQKAAIIDLYTDEIHEPHSGQSCNSSMSPTDAPEMMFLYLPHTRFGVKNKFGEEVWHIDKPRDSEEWQSPRWSNHPDYCSAIAKYGEGYKIVLIHMPTKKMVILRELKGDWSSPLLWFEGPGLLSEAGHAAARIVTEEQASAALLEAAEMPDAEQARAVYRKIAERFEGKAVAEEAESMLASAAFAQELEAQPMLNRLWMLEDRLSPVDGADPRYDDTGYFTRNRAVLIRMANLASKVRIDFPGTRAAASVEKIAEAYALPAHPPALLSEQIELVATVEAVSRVPTAAQIAPYREVVTFIRYKVDKVVAGNYELPYMVIAHWGMRDGKHTAAAKWRLGMRQRLTVDPFDSHAELDRITQASGANDASMEPFWALKTEEVGGP